MGKKAHQNASMDICVEKFETYAVSRNITLNPSTYGFYEVSKGNTRRLLGAVRAKDANDVTGWVINFADKERKFIADNDNAVHVGKKKYTPEECAKYRQPKPAV